MQCPVCTTVNLTMSERQGVEIDYCPQCRGVWLDRGELDKLIERAQADISRHRPAPAPPPAPAPRPEQQYRGHDDRGYYDKHDRSRKKKSFLDDIFDFG